MTVASALAAPAFALLHRPESTGPDAVDVLVGDVSTVSSLAELPLLEKWTRDVRSFEFMEGTGNIQRGHVARAFLQGRSR